MSRHLRFIPEGGALVEVTCRTVQGRLLLCPSQQLNDIILGVLGRAQRKHPVDIVAYVFTSNHLHLLLRVDTAKQLSDFMCYFNGNLAKEIGRRTGWKEKVWGRRYQSIVISDEGEMQMARLKYILAHGVKEGLVARVEDWPGVHCAVPLMTGAPGRGNLVRPDSGAQHPAAGEGAREGGVGEPGDRPAESAALLEAPGRGGLSRPDPADGPGDQ